MRIGTLVGLLIEGKWHESWYDTSSFDHVGACEGDYYPQPLRPQIDTFNNRIYERLNNGVYEAGFATSQEGL